MKKTIILLTAALCLTLLSACAAPSLRETQEPEETITLPGAEEASGQTPEAEVEPEAAENTAATPYTAILAQYKDAVKNDYYSALSEEERDAAFGPDVALEWRINPQPISYALVDLDGDGCEELIIGAMTDSEYPVYYDIWSCTGGVAARLFDMEFGYRVNFMIYNGGVIEVSWSDSAFESGYDYYRVENGAAVVTGSLVISSTAEGETTVTTFLQDGQEITEEEFNAKLQENTGAGAQQFAWLAIG